MKIPRYWFRARLPSARGGEATLTAWGWSFDGPAEARQLAEERLARLVERVRSGEPIPRAGYLYGDRPLREEIVEEHPSPDDGATMLVTRNSYGALILNTAGAMFVDVDLPPPPRQGLLARLFGKIPPQDDTVELARLRSRLEALPGRFRIYRTAAGWRVLATDRLYEPASAEAQAAMAKMGADPAYRQLCRVQESFRARLTPKPWRCGQSNPPSPFPREDARDRARFERWLGRYGEACRDKATCRLVESVADEWITPQLAPVVDLHDARTRASEALPLASAVLRRLRGKLRTRPVLASLHRPIGRRH